MRYFALCTLLLLLIVVLRAPSSAFANGGKGKTEDYHGFAGPGDNSIEFDTSLDRVIFLLTSVQNKYKIIQVRVRNNSGNPVRLSDAKDTVTVVFKNGEVKGILDIYRRDSAFWDALTPEMRKILGYPSKVLEGEEESVFVFIPSNSSGEIPDEVRYKIATLSDEIVIAPRGVASE